MYEESGPATNASIAVERCSGLLRHRPITRGGIQIGVDRTWLDVVDRDASAAHFSGERLSEHLDGSLRGGVGHKPGRSTAPASPRTDVDDSATILHVLQRRLGSREDAANVDVDYAVPLFQRRLLERFRNGCAGIVDKHIESAKCGDGLFNSVLDCFRVCSVRLDRDSLSATLFDRFDYGGGCARIFRVGDG